MSVSSKRDPAADGRISGQLEILHIVEALGGGLATALEGYIEHYSAHHVIVAKRRPAHQTGDLLAEKADFIPLPPSFLGQLWMVWRLVRRTDADVIHAHSSWAGFFARLPPRTRAGRLVYTPHCFAFERTDVPKVLRRLYWAAEKILARRTTLYAVSSKHEYDLAKALRPDAPVVIAPPALPARVAAHQKSANGRRDCSISEARRLTVSTAGRICPQKGIDFFCSVVDHMRDITASDAAVSIDWLWIGAGEPEVANLLLARGVEITGWVSRHEVLERLSRADAYVHTAEWEAGIPYSLLDAASCDVPVLARRISAMTGAESVLWCDTSLEMAHLIRALAEMDRSALAAQQASELLSPCLGEEQSRQLRRAYECEPDDLEPA